MISHFFSSLAKVLGASLHIKATGKNDHHLAEIVFKAVGRAIRSQYVLLNLESASTRGSLWI
jgi:imidazoleglycerol-phosphate dehydratase/histidinol-phosphatase